MIKLQEMRIRKYFELFLLLLLLFKKIAQLDLEEKVFFT